MKPEAKTLVYYDSEELLNWLESEHGIDKDELWGWLCDDPMCDIRNDSYGKWWIWDWIEYKEDKPDYVVKVADIIRKELCVTEDDDYIIVEYCW